MKREINYRCGHGSEEQVYGPISERERKVEWMESRLCPACYKSQQEQERQAERERAASASIENGLVPLMGSEKQVVWATTIRQKIYESLTKRFNPVPGQGHTPIVGVLNIETMAKWWIDNRDVDGLAIMKKIAAEHPEECKEINEKVARG